MRRSFASIVAALLYVRLTGDAAGAMLVFVAVAAAIGSARKVDA